MGIWNVLLQDLQRAFLPLEEISNLSTVVIFTEAFQDGLHVSKKTARTWSRSATAISSPPRTRDPPLTAPYLLWQASQQESFELNRSQRKGDRWTHDLTLQSPKYSP